MGQKADLIRAAVYGKDVRSTIADGIEALENLITDYNSQVINAGNSNAEIVEARGTFTKLIDRLNAADGALNDLKDLTTKTADITLKTKTLRKPKTSFFQTGTVSVDDGSGKVGEPFVVWDKDNNIWVMFYFLTSTGITVGRAVSNDLITWYNKTSNVSFDGLTSRHKLAILVDLTGEPVKINNRYHGYVVSAPPNKTIYHWECDNLLGQWYETGAVLSPNFANNATDAHGVDAPYAVWDYNKEQVVLFYMALPNDNLQDFGYSSRINRAVSKSPDTGFSYDGVVCVPSSDPNSWYYGWLGGMQVLKTDREMMVFLNASNVKPTGGGEEPDPSSIGIGFMDDLYSKIQVNGTPTLKINPTLAGAYNYIDEGSIWRGFAVLNKWSDRYMLFYNTGLVSGRERITYATEGVLKSLSGDLFVTTQKKIVSYSERIIPQGLYRFNFSSKIVYNGTGPIPNPPSPINVTVNLYRSSGALGSISETDTLIMSKTIFIGNISYENLYVNLDTIEMVNDNTNTRFFITCQCTEGTPTSDTHLKECEFVIEQI